MVYVATDNEIDVFSESTGALLWSKSANSVRSLSLSGTNLYFGGVFGLGAVNAETGAAVSWAPTADGTVNTVHATPAGVYVGGFFNKINGDSRVGVAQVDASSGATLAWSPKLSGTIWSLAGSGSQLLVSGAIFSMETSDQKNLAAFDASTGVPIAWDPGITDGSVEALTSLGTTLYVGGTFGHAGGSARGRGAAFNSTTGALQPWDPRANYAIRAIAANDEHVYIGGDFTKADTDDRIHFAELDNDTGAASGWDAGYVDGAVTALATRGDSLFVAGGFSSFGDYGAARLAGFDVVNRYQYNWFPEPNAYVRTLAVDSKSIYVGGQFTEIDGQPRNNLAEFSPVTLGLRSQVLNASASGYVGELAIGGSELVIGGSVTVGGSTLPLFSIDRSDGAVQSWQPEMSGFALALATSSDAVWVGGNITSIGTLPARGVARFTREATSAADYTPTDPTGPGLDPPDEPIDCDEADDYVSCCEENPDAYGCSSCVGDECCEEYDDCCYEYECCYEYDGCEETPTPTVPVTAPVVPIAPPAVPLPIVAKPIILGGSSSGKMLRLAIHSSGVSVVKIVIRNKRGKVVLRFSRILAPGLQVIKLKTSKRGHPRLAAGKYAVAVTASDGTTSSVSYKVRSARGH